MGSGVGCATVGTGSCVWVGTSMIVGGSSVSNATIGAAMVLVVSTWVGGLLPAIQMIRITKASKISTPAAIMPGCL